MKRCVISSREPWIWIDKFPDHSIMIVNPEAPHDRYNYLIQKSDYSLLVTDSGILERDGADYPGEKVLWYTSGTTGDSKFYGFSQEQLDTMSTQICHDYQLTANDRYFGIMPLWHAHGQGFYWAVKKAGCETQWGTIKDKQRLEKMQPTFLTAIPDLMPVVARLDLHQLRFLRTASAAMPEVIAKLLEQTFAVPVIEAFGMTETLSHCFTNPLHGPQRIGTVGLPSGIDAKIDQDNRLWLKGPCVFQQDWFDTGDLAQQDSLGYFRILGRSVDQINLKGIKYSPVSIENQVLALLPHLQELVIFGNHRIKCLYVGDAEPQDLHRALGSIIPKMKQPLILPVASIPKNSSNKISRSMLDSMFD